jgi:hypothetical protein
VLTAQRHPRGTQAKRTSGVKSTQSLLQEASPRVRETPGTTRKSSEGRTTYLLCCRSFEKGLPCSQLIASSCERGLQLKPMQVCFVRGLGSPCSQAGHLAHIAPVLNGCLGPPGSMRGPTLESMDQNWNRANPGHAKHAGRACVMGSNCLITSRAALALQASRPLAKTWSCGTPTPSGMSHTQNSSKRAWHSTCAAAEQRCAS